jgi:signal peptidase II
MSAVFRRGVIIAVLIVIVDQAVKYWLIGLLADEPYGVRITSFFNLVMVWNRGVSFGMFAGGEETRWLLVAISSAVSLALLGWLYGARNMVLGAGIGLVIGGAVGNIIDRVMPSRRAVADFFDFHVAGYHWPAFNVADMAIVIGIVFLVWDSLFKAEDSVKNTP